MSFGRNPHVAKAEAEEQKALGAKDVKAAERAWREAARQWDRAAARETDPKRRVELVAKVEAARAKADGRDADAEAERSDAEAERNDVASVPPELLN
jgi:hypothetical protein